MKILPLLLASIAPLTLHASEHITVHDNVELDAAGSGVVMRTLRWPSATRGMVDVEQKLQVNEVGDLEYDFHAQSEATKSFHRSYCAESGLDPFDGEVTFTPEAGGWNCSSIKLHGEGEVGDEAGTSTFPHDRSIDYVTARAPSGNVQAGVNFFGIGYITLRTSPVS